MRWFIWLVVVGCGGAEGDPANEPAVPWTGDDDAARLLEDEVLERVNIARAVGARCGSESFGPAPPLEADELLRDVARGHSADMGTRAFVDHVNPDGDDPFDRMMAAGFDGADPWGENVAGGYATAEEVVAGWLDSPGHCANLMLPDFAVIGIGFFDFGAGDPSLYRYYWTQNFAGSHGSSGR